jgi:hypothetical protein
VFWPPHLSQEVESIVSEKTTASEAVALVERIHQEQSSHVIHLPPTLAKSSFLELNDHVSVDGARSEVFWPPQLSQDVESIMSEKTTASEALAAVKRKHEEQKLLKELKLFSSPRDFVKSGGGIEPTNEYFEFDNNNFESQERVLDRMIQEIEDYPGMVTATLWQPLKDGLESASSYAQDGVASSSCSKDVALLAENGATSRGLPYDVQPYIVVESHTIDEESRSGIDKYDAFEYTADVNEGKKEHNVSGVGESDKYAVDEITARSLVIMSDPTLRHRSNSFSSEMYEEIDVIYEHSEDISQNGNDWIPADNSDDSQSTTQYESFASHSGPSFDDSFDSEDTYSESSGSEIQEEIEVFEESDYSDVSSRSKYSTSTEDDNSEYSDETTMSQAIKREIRYAKRMFGFLS